MDHTVQNRPGSDLDGLVRVWPNASGLDPIWIALSGFGQTHPVWKQAGMQESSGPVSGRTSFLLPVFHFQTRLQSSTDSPDHTVLNQPGSCLVPADGVRFWPNGSGPEASL